MPTPPLKDVLDALSHAVLPGAGGAALVACAFLLLGRWAGALGTAAAVAVGFMWGNFALDPNKPDRPTWATTARLIPWSPEADAPGYQWLARVALVLVVAGLVSRWLGLLAERLFPERFRLAANVFVWAPRAGVVFTVSAWMVLGKAAEGPEWATLRWQLAAVMFLVWVAADGVARAGHGAEVAALLGASLFAGGTVLLYTHNAKFMELAVLAGSALFGAAVATAARGERFASAASGAIPLAVAFLPGLVLGTRPSHDEHKVPVACFWLVALAPVLLAPFLIPRIARQNRWLLLAGRVLLVLVPLVVAVVLAGQHEQLPFEKESEW